MGEEGRAFAGSRFAQGAWLSLLTVLLCAAWSAQAQAAPVTKLGYITMSDGVKLRYAAVLPDEDGRFPVAMKYDGYCEGTNPLTCNEGTGETAQSLLDADYAVVGVQLRGTGCSEAVSYTHLTLPTNREV